MTRPIHIEPGGCRRVSVSIRAFAKINLTLDVIARRPDGYHDLRMVMQPLALHDEVLLTRQDRLTIETDDPTLPQGEGNLAYRAAEVLAQAVGHPLGASVIIQKHIPVAAGLAGGSADAAAVLQGLNRLYGLGFGPERLAALALRLGSDVPFCLLNRTALAEGRGERLTLLPAAPRVPVVVATPHLSWSGPKTATVFRHFRTEAVDRRPDLRAMIAALSERDTAGVASHMLNVLEPVAISMHPVVAELKRAMLGEGAIGAAMTGAGPTIVAIAPSPAGRERIAHAARRFTDMVVETEFLV